MLVELYSSAFKEKNKIRKPIIFKNGLNIILGLEDGRNSIGKSSLMLAIDFAFGGSSYAKCNGVVHEGHHNVGFAFEFGNDKFYFIRNTQNPEIIYRCNRNYELLGESLKKDDFTAWLSARYNLSLQSLSFRKVVSLFFRIYGKENDDEKRPLNLRPTEKNTDIIERLIELFGKNPDIAVYKNAVDVEKEKLEAYRTVRKYRIVSDLVGGKKQFEKNINRIKELEAELDTLSNNQPLVVSENEIEKKQQLNQLESEKLNLETILQAKKRQEQMIDISMEYGLYPSEADLVSLQEFFPDANLRKIFEIEKYHKKLASILGQKFATEKEELSGEISKLQNQISLIHNEINKIGVVENFSKDFLDKHSSIKSEISMLNIQNDAYSTLIDLQESKENAISNLRKKIECILIEIQESVNNKMRQYNDSLSSEKYTAPELLLKDYNSYSFSTPNNDGTGANYKGMILFDLAILYLTELPAIAHDSMLLKDMQNGVIEGLIKLYQKSTKQIFLAFDKQIIYSQEVKKILEDNCVIQLSDNNGALYGHSWNKEEKQ